MTAGLSLNYSWSADSNAPTPPRPADPVAVRSIVIVGGGTAGWMTALILAQSLIARGVEITVLESPTVPSIGVGEGSTPWLRGFFNRLGIEEAE
jgi:tryptophan 6-halogenase